MVTSSCGCSTGPTAGPVRPRCGRPTGPSAGPAPPDSMRTASSDGPIAESQSSGCQKYVLRASRQPIGSPGPTTSTSAKPSRTARARKWRLVFIRTGSPV